MHDFTASLQAEFALSNEALQTLSRHFCTALDNGLAYPLGDKSITARPSPRLPMLPAFVTARIDGQEQGTFLALDLGGTNLRVCRVDLQGNGVITLNQHQMRITEEMKAKPAQELFDDLADFIRRFLDHYPLQESEHSTKLGFTFSFGVQQTRIDNGVLLNWSKGFTSSGVEGKDVSILMQDALYRLDVKVKVVAIVNDTVGALLAGAYQDPRVNVGVIFGTGTNAAYYEHMSCVKETGDVHAQEMIVNTEWGAFDAHDKCLLPYTRFDNRLDRESENARLQVFEKMISGRYLGEVVRLILLEAIDRMILFGGHSSEAMDTPYRFDTAYVSKCVLDNSNDLNEVASLFEHTLGVGESRTSLDERRHIQHICKMAIERAALLSSAALSALLLKRRDLFADGNKVGVGADGSVYEHLPGFVDHMKHGLHTIMGDLAHQVFFVLAKDGSGIGAALTALVASKA